jgi:FAD dependent oxidoreductase
MVEVFPRAGGSTLITAFSDESALPLDPAAVTPDPDEIDRLQAIAERLSPMFRAEKIIARQACFRPVTQDGLPLIGKVPRSEGAYVASGHLEGKVQSVTCSCQDVAAMLRCGEMERKTMLQPFQRISVCLHVRRNCIACEEETIVSIRVGPLPRLLREILIDAQLTGREAR